jgi:hypothetical protein
MTSTKSARASSKTVADALSLPEVGAASPKTNALSQEEGKDRGAGATPIEVVESNADDEHILVERRRPSRRRVEACTY